MCVHIILHDDVFYRTNKTANYKLQFFHYSIVRAQFRIVSFFLLYMLHVVTELYAQINCFFSGNAHIRHAVHPDFAYHCVIYMCKCFNHSCLFRIKFLNYILDHYRLFFFSKLMLEMHCWC